jgi:hypothetical protein
MAYVFSYKLPTQYEISTVTHNPCTDNIYSAHTSTKKQMDISGCKFLHSAQPSASSSSSSSSALTIYIHLPAHIYQWVPIPHWADKV